MRECVHCPAKCLMEQHIVKIRLTTFSIGQTEPRRTQQDQYAPCTNTPVVANLPYVLLIHQKDDR